MATMMDSIKEDTYSFEEDREYSVDVEKNFSRLKFSNIPSRSKYILCLCSLAGFFSECSFSIMAPFYPNEAERKGMEPATIGFIFSMFEFIIFVSSPIIGNFVATIGPKYVFMTGIFLGGICNVLFGKLHLCPPGPTFIILSFIIRSIQAFGFSCYVNTLFAIVSTEFPKHVSTAFGILQTATGTGLMLGPVIGGVLYEIGGFGLPFYVIGIAVIINGLVVFSCLPQPRAKEELKRTRSIFSLISTPMVYIPMLSICTSSLGITFLEPTLAKHLEPFHLATVTVSLFFVIPPLMNSLSSPIWGYLTDTKNVQGPILVLGHLFFGVGFLIMGPSVLLPFISFEISNLAIGLVLAGVAFASILITSLKCMVIGAFEHGFEDNIDTYAVVGSIFNCMYTLGGCIGPMLGGILGQKYSSSLSFTVVGLISTGMTFVTWFFFIIKSTYEI